MNEKNKHVDSILSEINTIHQRYNYKEISSDFSIGPINDNEYFKSKYICHDDAMCINEVPIHDAAIVTGFGPTNTPTAGTLSVMLKALSLQRETGIHTSIIVSDLGAWNSRNINWYDIKKLTNTFIEFILELGFNTENGVVRSHQDKQNLVVSGLISKIVEENDFKENKEATDQLYDLLNLRGSFFGIMQDGLYTISDIVNPLFSGKKRVLVMAGIEEHYFPELSKLVIQRMNARYKDQFIQADSKVGAIYARLIGGLYPYPKMSKSIPESSINIGDTEKDIMRKIIECGHENEKVIMQMIELVSDWSVSKIKNAKVVFEDRHLNPGEWRNIKEEYLQFFIETAKLWNRLSSKMLL